MKNNMKNNDPKYKRALKRALRLASLLNISVDFGDELLYANYKGNKRIELEISPRYLIDGSAVKKTLISLLHELGHYIVAPPQRRRRKDYGIPNNIGFNDEKRRLRWDYEDVKAQMVQKELENFLGVNFTKKSFASEYKKELRRWWDSTGRVTTKTFIDLMSTNGY